MGSCETAGGGDDAWIYEPFLLEVVKKPRDERFCPRCGSELTSTRTPHRERHHVDDLVLACASCGASWVVSLD